MFQLKEWSNNHCLSWIFGISSPKNKLTLAVKASVAKNDMYLSVNKIG